MPISTLFRILYSVPPDALYGACVADGSGAFARECFCEGAEVFLDLCRDAVHAAELHQWNQREYELLSAARGIAGV